MKKYLYLDDEALDAIKPIIDGLNRSGKIVVERVPLEQDETIDRVYSSLRKIQYDGIIVDYMLNGTGPFHIGCNSHSIAQYLRDLAEQGESKSFPIVLCSTNQNIKRQLQNGYTSNDLYDFHFAKDIDINYELIASRLENIAVGYEEIIKSGKDISHILKRAISNLDPRPFEPFAKSIQTKRCADLILQDFFKFSGLLISEEILCARLGIAKVGSYKEILSIFDRAKYSGVFNELGRYYWFDIVSGIFREYFNENMASLDAEEKVELMKRKFVKASLEVAPIGVNNNSKRYWTTCEKTGVALDPMEGYRLKEAIVLKPWQEPHYVSFSAISDGYVDYSDVIESDLERYTRKVDFISKRKNNGKE